MSQAARVLKAKGEAGRERGGPFPVSAVLTAPTLVTRAATQPLPSPRGTAAAPPSPGLTEALPEETRARGTQAELVLNPRHQI